MSPPISSAPIMPFAEMNALLQKPQRAGRHHRSRRRRLRRGAGRFGNPGGQAGGIDRHKRRPTVTLRAPPLSACPRQQTDWRAEQLDPPVYNRSPRKPSRISSEVLELKRINDHVSVSPQISPDDVAAIKAPGFVDHHQQPPGRRVSDQPARRTMIERRPTRPGLPIITFRSAAKGVTPQMVEETEAVLEGSDGPVFCLLPFGHALDDAVGADARRASSRPARSSRRRRMPATTCPISRDI